MYISLLYGEQDVGGKIKYIEPCVFFGYWGKTGDCIRRSLIYVKTRCNIMCRYLKYDSLSLDAADQF